MVQATNLYQECLRSIDKQRRTNNAQTEITELSARGLLWLRFYFSLKIQINAPNT